MASSAPGIVYAIVGVVYMRLGEIAQAAIKTVFVRLEAMIPSAVHSEIGSLAQAEASHGIKMKFSAMNG
jgi:hypothetical protein